MDPATRVVRTYYHVRFVEDVSHRLDYLRVYDDRQRFESISQPDDIDLSDPEQLEARILTESVRKLFTKPSELPTSRYDEEVLARAGLTPCLRWGKVQQMQVVMPVSGLASLKDHCPTKHLKLLLREEVEKTVVVL